jgi:hypothetical protein
MRGPARPLPSGSAAPARPPNLPALGLQLLDAAAAALERQALSAASAPEAFGAWSLKAALPLERTPLRAPVLCDRAAEVLLLRGAPSSSSGRPRGSRRERLGTRA